MQRVCIGSVPRVSGPAWASIPVLGVSMTFLEGVFFFLGGVLQFFYFYLTDLLLIYYTFRLCVPCDFSLTLFSVCLLFILLLSLLLLLLLYYCLNYNDRKRKGVDLGG